MKIQKKMHYIILNEAIEMNPNIHYARIVKFDICEKFNLQDEMEEIINFFIQPEHKVKYQNNVTCFRSIIMARNGEVDKAVEYFKASIRDYTDEAKDKFVVRLNKYTESSEITV